MADESQAPGEKPTQPVASSAAAAPAAPASAQSQVPAQPAAAAAPSIADKAAASVAKPGEVAPAAAQPANVSPAEAAKAAVEKAAADKAAADAAAAKTAADDAAAKKAADDKATSDAAAANQVPEKYELVAAPGVAINPAAVEAITPVLKKAGVTGAVAQELVTSYLAYQAAEIPRIAARQLEAIKADPSIGGDNFGRTMARVNAALTEFSTPEDRAEMEAKGLANFPPYVRWMEKVGRWLDPQPQTDPGPQERGKLPREKRLYGGGDLVQTGRRAQ